jgi:hypothetical protein
VIDAASLIAFTLFQRSRPPWALIAKFNSSLIDTPVRVRSEIIFCKAQSLGNLQRFTRRELSRKLPLSSIRREQQLTAGNRQVVLPTGVIGRRRFGSENMQQKLRMEDGDEIVAAYLDV